MWFRPILRVAHTAGCDPNPWWQVYLASSSLLKSVDIKEQTPCNSSRLIMQIVRGYSFIDKRTQWCDWYKDTWIYLRSKHNSLPFSKTCSSQPIQWCHWYKLRFFWDYIQQSTRSDWKFMQQLLEIFMLQCRNSDFEVNLDAQNVPIRWEFQFNTVLLEFYLRADVHWRLSIKPVRPQNVYRHPWKFWQWTSIDLNDSSFSFMIEVITADFVETRSLELPL